MSIDKTLLVDDIEDVTPDLVMKGMERAMGYGNTSDNLFFPSGDPVYIYGTEVDAPKFVGEGMRRVMWSSISFRNYCGACELLVKDSKGNHLVYNRINGLSKNALAEEYYHEICVVRHMIDGVAENAYKDVQDSMYEESRQILEGGTLSIRLWE